MEIEGNDQRHMGWTAFLTICGFCTVVFGPIIYMVAQFSAVVAAAMAPLMVWPVALPVVAVRALRRW